MNLQKLISQWRSEADQYQRQVDEARAKGTPHDQMLSGATFLRQCAKELEGVINRSEAHLGVSNEWSGESRERLSKKGQTTNLKKGTAAAQQSPVAGPFETNQEAKLWSLTSPNGQEYTVVNLKKFIRENAPLFDGTVEQAHAGLRQVQLAITGKTKRTVSQWKGWRLKQPAQAP